MKTLILGVCATSSDKALNILLLAYLFAFLAFLMYDLEERSPPK